MSRIVNETRLVYYTEKLWERIKFQLTDNTFKNAELLPNSTIVQFTKNNNQTVNVDLAKFMNRFYPVVDLGAAEANRGNYNNGDIIHAQDTDKKYLVINNDGINNFQQEAIIELTPQAGINLPIDATNVNYDNNQTNLAALNVQAAIDEIHGILKGGYNASNYDNATGKLTLIKVDGQRDEYDLATGTVRQVNGKDPDPNGNVVVEAGDINYSNVNSQLPAQNVQTAIDEVNNKFNNYVPIANVTNTGGIANADKVVQLDGQGLLNANMLPKVATNEYYEVADMPEAENKKADCQNGDVIKVLDTNKTYLCVDATKQNFNDAFIDITPQIINVGVTDVTYNDNTFTLNIDKSGQITPIDLSKLNNKINNVDPVDGNTNLDISIVGDDIVLSANGTEIDRETLTGYLKDTDLTKIGGDPQYADKIPQLDQDGKLSTTMIPDLAITSVTNVADKQEALNKIQDGSIQVGDVVVVAPNNEIYMYNGTPAGGTFENSFIQLSLGDGTVKEVNGKKPAANGQVVVTSSDIAYDKAISGLQSDNVKDAIDELNGKFIEDITYDETQNRTIFKTKGGQQDIVVVEGLVTRWKHLEHVEEYETPNLIDYDKRIQGYWYTNNGNNGIPVTNDRWSIYELRVKPSTQYTIQRKVDDSSLFIYYNDDNFVRVENANRVHANGWHTHLLDIPVGVNKVGICFQHNLNAKTSLMAIESNQPIATFVPYGGNIQVGYEVGLKFDNSDCDIKSTTISDAIKELSLRSEEVDWRDLSYVEQYKYINLMDYNKRIDGQWYDDNSGVMKPNGAWSVYELDVMPGNQYTILRKKDDSTRYVYFNGVTHVSTEMVVNTSINEWNRQTITIPQGANKVHFCFQHGMNQPQEIMVLEGEIIEHVDFIPYVSEPVNVLVGLEVGYKFNNTNTNLQSTTVANAIRELDKKIINAGRGTVNSVNNQLPDPQGDVTVKAEHIEYDNQTSQLTSQNVQEAINELNGKFVSNVSFVEATRTLKQTKNNQESEVVSGLVRVWKDLDYVKQYPYINVLDLAKRQQGKQYGNNGQVVTANQYWHIVEVDVEENTEYTLMKTHSYSNGYKVVFFNTNGSYHSEDNNNAPVSNGWHRKTVRTPQGVTKVGLQLQYGATTVPRANEMMFLKGNVTENINPFIPYADGNSIQVLKDISLEFDNSNSNLKSTTVESAIKEVNNRFTTTVKSVNDQLPNDLGNVTVDATQINTLNGGSVENELSELSIRKADKYIPTFITDLTVDDIKLTNRPIKTALATGISGLAGTKTLAGNTDASIPQDTKVSLIRVGLQDYLEGETVTGVEVYAVNKADNTIVERIVYEGTGVARKPKGFESSDVLYVDVEVNKSFSVEVYFIARLRQNGSKGMKLFGTLGTGIAFDKATDEEELGQGTQIRNISSRVPNILVYGETSLSNAIVNATLNSTNGIDFTKANGTIITVDIPNSGGGTVTSVNGINPQGGNVVLTSQVTQNVSQDIVLRVGNQDFATLQCMTDQEADTIIAGFTL